MSEIMRDRRTYEMLHITDEETPDRLMTILAQFLTPDHMAEAYEFLTHQAKSPAMSGSGWISISPTGIPNIIHPADVAYYYEDAESDALHEIMIQRGGIAETDFDALVRAADEELKKPKARENVVNALAFLLAALDSTDSETKQD